MNTCYENNYVYLLYDEKGVAFYVGLGAVTARCNLGYRIYQHIRDAKAYVSHGKVKTGEQNIDKLNVMKRILEAGFEIGYEIIASELTRDQANAMERSLIHKFGRLDLGTGSLVNKNNGGAGSKSPSKEVRQKIAKAHRGKIVSEETRQKQSIVRKGRIITKEWREKISIAKKNETHSIEHNTKVGQATKKRWADQDYRQRMLKAIRRKWLITFPDGHTEIHHGLQELISAYPELKMPSLTQSGKKGKPYKGFLAERIDQGK